MTSTLPVASRREATRSALLERQLQRYHPNVQGKVRALAMRHTRLADLAASFPALLFALAVPRAGIASARARACVVDGRSLADAAAAAGIPLWLRRLPPEAFTAPITGLPDDELFRRQIANHLPLSPKLAPIWLRSVAAVAELAHGPAAVWIARELVRAPPRTDPVRLRLVGLWAWFSTQPATLGHTLIDRRWTPSMQIGSALAAADAWSTMIALHVSLGSEKIADMWLQPGRVDGYDFIPLNSTTDISEEAEAMQNCLRTYGPNLAHNRSRLWSIRRNGQRVATLKSRRVLRARCQASPSSPVSGTPRCRARSGGRRANGCIATACCGWRSSNADGAPRLSTADLARDLAAVLARQAADSGMAAARSVAQGAQCAVMRIRHRRVVANRRQQSAGQGCRPPQDSRNR